MNEVAALVTAGVTIISVIVTAVWAISAFRTDAALLRQSIAHLAETVSRLGTKIEHLDKRSDDLDRRLFVLEAQRNATRPRDASSGT